MSAEAGLDLVLEQERLYCDKKRSEKTEKLRKVATAEALHFSFLVECNRFEISAL